MTKLINEKTGSEIQVGDKLLCFRGEEYILQGFKEPHKPSSTGRVYVKAVLPDGREGMSREFFPSVVGAKIIGHQFED
jgi:hypothetical protein